MHLNDALGHTEGIHSVYNHHGQACAIAAEGYTRLTGKIAAICVISGQEELMQLQKCRFVN